VNSTEGELPCTTLPSMHNAHSHTPTAFITTVSCLRLQHTTRSPCRMNISIHDAWARPTVQTVSIPLNTRPRARRKDPHPAAMAFHMPSDSRHDPLEVAPSHPVCLATFSPSAEQNPTPTIQDRLLIIKRMAACYTPVFYKTCRGSCGFSRIFKAQIVIADTPERSTKSKR
jgi:hypothetical protein